MAQLKGFKKLAQKTLDLQEEASRLQSALDEKREWWEDKSEKWQESDTGQAWSAHLDLVEEFLSDLDCLNVPDPEEQV